MAKSLPIFRYHPDPIATGSIERSDVTCDCCGEKAGYRCTSSLYSQEEVEDLCPWCIADGSAAEKFQGNTVDGYALIVAGLPSEIIDEVTKRTPGFASWQQEKWLTHCSDACEFQGDAPAEELNDLAPAVLSNVAALNGMNVNDITEIMVNYSPGGNPCVFKWKCRHCGVFQYWFDFT